jgi:hypothetical protein
MAGGSGSTIKTGTCPSSSSRDENYSPASSFACSSRRSLISSVASLAVTGALFAFRTSKGRLPPPLPWALLIAALPVDRPPTLFSPRSRRSTCTTLRPAAPLAASTSFGLFHWVRLLTLLIVLLLAAALLLLLARLLPALLVLLIALIGRTRNNVALKSNVPSRTKHPWQSTFGHACLFDLGGILFELLAIVPL